MSASPAGPSSLVLAGGKSSGMTVSLHPLAILNISDHYNRARFAPDGYPKLIGALLGSEAERNVSIVNSFELVYGAMGGDDEPMSSAAEPGLVQINEEFIQRRREQFKEVFPTLDIVGWYTVGDEPKSEDLALHTQISALVQTPVFLTFNPRIPPQSQDVPVKTYETALVEGDGEESIPGRFVELSYGVETGEAERIAVDGVSRGGMGNDGEESVANLVTQRNAIRMLYDRLAVLLRYVSAVTQDVAPKDQGVLRQIHGLTSSIPLMDGSAFNLEFTKEYEDVSLTAHLMSLVKQVNALSDFSEKHNVLYAPLSEEFGGESSFAPQGPGGLRPVSRPSQGVRRRKA